jgi:hypothetical protein
MFLNILEYFPYNWYKIEEAIGDTWSYKYLREKIIKGFSFVPAEVELEDVM